MRAAFLFFLSFLLVSGAAVAQGSSIPVWRILEEKSEIAFLARYGSQEIAGAFPSYTASIVFDPEHPETGKVTVKIETGKVETNDKDAKEYLPTGEWFASSQYPLAVFESSALKQVKDNEYEATGTLTLRDKSVPVTLPFHLEIFNGDGADSAKRFARMHGTIMLKRLDFGVGGGQWSDTATVANDVIVRIRLEAVTP